MNTARSLGARIFTYGRSISIRPCVFVCIYVSIESLPVIVAGSLCGDTWWRLFAARCRIYCSVNH